MKVIVKPVYGFGWRRGKSSTSVDVPPELLVDFEVIEAGSPFNTAIGLTDERAHLLTGLWILLQKRTGDGEPTYNLLAYNGKPRLDHTQTPYLTGFANVLSISN